MEVFAVKHRKTIHTKAQTPQDVITLREFLAMTI